MEVCSVPLALGGLFNMHQEAAQLSTLLAITYKSPQAQEAEYKGKKWSMVMSQTDPMTPLFKSTPINSVVGMMLKAEKMVGSLRSNEPTYGSYFPLSWTKNRRRWTWNCLQLGFGQLLKVMLLNLDTLFSHAHIMLQTSLSCHKVIQNSRHPWIILPT